MFKISGWKTSFHNVFTGARSEKNSIFYSPFEMKWSIVRSGNSWSMVFYWVKCHIEVFHEKNNTEWKKVFLQIRTWKNSCSTKKFQRGFSSEKLNWQFVYQSFFKEELVSKMNRERMKDIRVSEKSRKPDFSIISLIFFKFAVVVSRYPFLMIVSSVVDLIIFFDGWQFCRIDQIFWHFNEKKR